MILPTFDMEMDSSELEADVRRVLAGEMQLPTVSAIVLLIDGTHLEEVPVYLTEEDFA